MSALRQQMIDAMRLRGFSPRTHRSYLTAGIELAKFHRRSPDALDVAALQAFFSYLALDRGLAGSSCRVMYQGVRFLYLQVLGWKQFDVSVVMPKKAQRIPELLTCAEVAALLEAPANGKHWMLLTLCWAQRCSRAPIASVRESRMCAQTCHWRGDSGCAAVSSGRKRTTTVWRSVPALNVAAPGWQSDHCGLTAPDDSPAPSAHSAWSCQVARHRKVASGILVG